MSIEHRWFRYNEAAAYKYEMEGLCVKHKFICNEMSEREKPAVNKIASRFVKYITAL